MLKLGFVSALISALGCLVVLSCSAYEVINNKQTLGNFLMLTIFLFQSFLPINSFGFSFRQIKRGIIDINNIEELMLFNVRDKKEGSILEVNDNVNVYLENVYIDFKGKKILDNISGGFEIEKHKPTILKGMSGVGKSSIGKLMVGLLEHDKGNVLINNIKLNNISLESLKKNISFCSQDIILFNDSIKNNILYANPSASIDEFDKVINAVGLQILIDKNEEHEKFIVGERGTKISGGERQKVALARSILKESKIIILDEPTTGLDSFNKEKIISLIKDLTNIYFILIISHDLDFIKSLNGNEYEVTRRRINKC